MTRILFRRCALLGTSPCCTRVQLSRTWKASPPLTTRRSYRQEVLGGAGLGGHRAFGDRCSKARFENRTVQMGVAASHVIRWRGPESWLPLRWTLLAFPAFRGRDAWGERRCS